VKGDVSLCEHLAAIAPGEPPFTMAPAEILDWQDGPVLALVRCRSCAGLGWLQLHERDRGRRVRAFALAGIAAPDVAVFLRNRRSASCDVTRARAELEALAACAGPFERLVTWDSAAERVVAAAPFAADARP
jgi:hypothetical protein